jgi:hypothetical protein
MVDFASSFYNPDWKTISIAIAGLSIIASTILIMLSRLFSMRNLEQVAKTEFVFAVSTVVIVMMVLALITTAEQQLAGSNKGLARCLFLMTSSPPKACTAGDVVTDAYDPNNRLETLIDWMKLYMSAPALCVQKFMNILYVLEVPIAAMTSVYMEIFMSEHASGFGVKWIEERIMNAASSMTFYMYAFFIMIHTFNFIKYYAGFFFSVGVALRALPPTRGVGAYVMTLAFGLYFVFPLAYITVATLFLPHVNSDIVSMQNSGGSIHSACVLPNAPDISQLNCGGATVARAFELPDIIKSSQDVLTDMLSVGIDGFTRHLVYAICVFPMIAFTILLTFVLNTTNLFGGNIPEIGRGLVKLI